MNQFWRIFYVRMAEADAGEGGGAGGAGIGDGVAGSGDAGQAGSAASGTGDGSGTGAGDGGASALAQAGQGQAPSIPEKYQVKKADGTLDVEASSLKLAEAYGNLEKRIGTGDIPPKTAEEYTIPVPDEMKELFDPKTDPLMGAFLKDAHAAGLTQKQMDLVMGKYFELAPQLVEGGQQLSADACIANLKQDWKTDEQYKAEVGKAFKAAQAFGDKDAEAIVKDYGNDPRIIRLLARVGGELGEDTSINPGGSLPNGQTVEGLMQSEAYTNPKHADHARVSAQVSAHFAKQADAAAKAGNVPIL
jgi:hypothetical protein